MLKFYFNLLQTEKPAAVSNIHAGDIVDKFISSQKSKNKMFYLEFITFLCRNGFPLTPEVLIYY